MDRLDERRREGARARGGAAKGPSWSHPSSAAGRGRLGREWASPPGGVYASIVLRPDRRDPRRDRPAARGRPRRRARPRVARRRRAAQVAERHPAPRRAQARRGAARGAERGVADLLDRRRHRDQRARRSRSEPRRRSSTRRPARRTRCPRSRPPCSTRSRRRTGNGWREASRSSARPTRERSWLDGREVRVSDAAGRLVAAGRVAGIDACGRLVVMTEGGRVDVTSGDVTLREDVTTERMTMRGDFRPRSVGELLDDAIIDRARRTGGRCSP